VTGLGLVRRLDELVELDPVDGRILLDVVRRDGNGDLTDLVRLFVRTRRTQSEPLFEGIAQVLLFILQSRYANERLL